MNESNVVSFWGLLRWLFSTVLVIALILPLLMVAELFCIPEGMSNWLWNLGCKLIGGTGD